MELGRAPGFPHPRSPASAGLEKFLRPSGVGAASSAPRSSTLGLLPSPAAHRPDPALPGGGGEGGAGRQQPLPGTRRPPHSARRLGPPPAPRGERAG